MGAHAWVDGALEGLGTELAGRSSSRTYARGRRCCASPLERRPMVQGLRLRSFHEPAAIEILARRRPRTSPPPRRRPRSAGCSADGGMRLRELGEPARWVDVLALYADLQAEAVRGRRWAAGRGVPDRRLDRLPELYESLLRSQDGIVGRPARLVDLRPHCPRLCQSWRAPACPRASSATTFTRATSSCGTAATCSSTGRRRVAHPFFSLHVTMRVLAYELGVDPHRASSRAWTPTRALDPCRFPGRAGSSPTPCRRARGSPARWPGRRSSTLLPPDVRHEYADTVGDRLAQFLAKHG